MRLKISGNELQQAASPANFTTGADQEATGTLSGGLRKSAVDSVQIPAVQKSISFGNNPPKGAIHTTAVSISEMTEAGWQKTDDPVPTSAQMPIQSSAGPVALPQFEAKSQSFSPANPSQPDAAAGPIPARGAAPADSGASAANTNLTNTSTNGQGKMGQQSGQAPGENLVCTKPSIANLTTNLAPDSTTNILPPPALDTPANHAGTSTPQTPPSSSGLPPTLSAWQNYDGGVGKIVTAAAINRSIDGAEMHVELRSPALGAVELRAIVSGGSVGAEIHVQGQEAHTLLAAGLPSLERALGERNLRVENITVHQGQTGGEMGGGEKQNPQSGSYGSAQRQVLIWDNPPQPSNVTSGSLEDENPINSPSGLSVRA
jgi:flagellar hook-length control protein FliK